MTGTLENTKQIHLVTKTDSNNDYADTDACVISVTKEGIENLRELFEEISWLRIRPRSVYFELPEGVQVTFVKRTNEIETILDECETAFSENEIDIERASSESGLEKAVVNIYDQDAFRFQAEFKHVGGAVMTVELSIDELEAEIKRRLKKGKRKNV